MTYKELLNSLECDNKIRSLTVDEVIQLKSVMFECYQDLKKICDKYDISLMLGGGSAIGAVRHHGFIPWDDDFDLMISRDDFNKLKSIFEVNLGEKYILNSPNYSSNPTNRFPKILIKGTKFVEAGEDAECDTNKIKIDLFIIENVPQNKFVRFLHGILCSGLMYIASCVSIYEEKDSDLNKLMRKTKDGRRFLQKRLFIGKIFSSIPYVRWCNIVDSVCQYKKEGEYVTIPSGRKHYFGELQKRSTFYPVSEGDFEGIIVQLPNDVDAYLSNLYGNYMEIPPVDKREKHLISEIQFK